MPPDQSSERPAGRRDERLRLARRIDWRFLLTSPDLGRVVVSGTPDTDLTDALGAADVGGRPADGPADTVVVTGRFDLAALRVAATATGPRGRLIVEVDGRRPPMPIRPPGAAVRVARILAAGGWGTVRTWWTWPTRGRATAWARTDDPIAVRAMVSRRLGGTPGAIAGRIAATMSDSEVARRVLEAGAPSLTIAAERGVGTSSFIEQRLGRQQGVLMLTPRYRASAHVVALALLPGTGAPDRVVKVARLRDDPGLAHEAAVLGALEASGTASTSGPRLLDTDPGYAGWASIVESGVAGSPLDPDAVRADRTAAVASIVAWLAGLPVGPAGDRRTDVDRRLDAALADICAFDERSGSTTDLGSLARRTVPIVAPLGTARLPTVFEHGDPAHPNLIRLEGGGLSAVDWERGEPDGLPLHDLTMALAYVASADAGASDAVDQAAAFETAVRGSQAWARRALDADLVRLGLDQHLQPALVVAAWARSVAWLARALGTADPSWETARWLAADRSAALWRVALSLAETG